MIYIITPNLKDFKSMCLAKNIPYKFNFNRITFHPDVIWVSNIQQLSKIRIKKEDDVFFGLKFSDFSEEERVKIHSMIPLGVAK